MICRTTGKGHPTAIMEIIHPNVDRSLAIWEIGSVITSCLIAEWVVTAVVGVSSWLIAVPVVFAFGFMFLSHRIRSESLREIGFRFDNFGQALRLLILPMVLATAVPNVNAATKLKKAAHRTAWPGVSTRVVTTVAMEFAAS